MFNLFIIIGAGHGGVPLGYFEVIGLRNLLSGDFQFNICGGYDEKTYDCWTIQLLRTMRFD